MTLYLSEDYEIFENRELKVGYLTACISNSSTIYDCTNIELAKRLAARLCGSIKVMRGQGIVLKLMCTSYPVTVAPGTYAPYLPESTASVASEFSLDSQALNISELSGDDEF